MKREIPLFIIDTKKSHKKGECDFLVCTDKDSGFVAKIEYITASSPEYGDDYRIDYCRNGLSVRLSIKRFIGENPNTGNIRTLMKKGLEYYVEAVTLAVDATKATTDECIDFIEKLADGNKQYLDEAGIDFDERKIILTSLMMLDAVKNKLYKLKLQED